MRITYDTIALTAIHSLNRSFIDLNKTTNSLLSEVGIRRAASPPAGTSVAALVILDMSVLSSAIAATNTQISMNQTADDALDTIHEKMDSMRDLVQEVELGGLSEQEIEDRASQYEALADDIKDILADTKYGGVHLFTGFNPLVELDFDEVLEMDLTDLPSEPTGIVSKGMLDITAERSDLSYDTAQGGLTVADMMDHLATLTVFDSRIENAEAALAVLASIVELFITQMANAVTAQANASPKTAAALLGSAFGPA